MDLDVSAQPGEQMNGASSPPLMEQAKQKTQEVVHLTQQKAGEAMEQAGDQIRTRLDETKTSAADSLTGVAQALRTGTQHVRDQGESLPMGPTVAGYAESAAETVEHVAGYLREKNVDQMVTEVEGFARRQPAVFLGSALAIGFLAARFLKSSNPAAQQRMQSMQGGSDRLLPVAPESYGSPNRVDAMDMRSGYDPAPTAG